MSGSGRPGGGAARSEGDSGPILPGGKVDPDAIRRAALDDDDEALRRVAFVLKRDLRARLDKYLTSRITFMSRSQLQRLIEQGGVCVNEKPAKASTRLRLGDRVEVVVPPPPSTEIQPEQIPLDVLYEDEHLIVLNKRADIIVHPARSELSGTMVNALTWRFAHESGGSLSQVGSSLARPGVVHRLDRHTSGCIVFAKTDEAHWKLGHQFEHRRVDKRYLAVVHGRVEPEADVIQMPIGPHPSRAKGYREKCVVRHDHLGKDSITIYRLRERYSLSGAAPGIGDHLALVELELKTGRTHQIRVHLSESGWPIVGDAMYGGRAMADPESGETIIEHPALHAALLAFTHPITGRPMSFTAPVRTQMRDLILCLRRVGRPESLSIGGAIVNLEAAIAGD